MNNISNINFDDSFLSERDDMSVCTFEPDVTYFDEEFEAINTPSIITELEGDYSFLLQESAEENFLCSSLPILKPKRRILWVEQ
ncbi:hypothetical protein [Alistipes onderdonkii]|uniref:hypothetical protein n=1 Tax=Alistipes onderdonkii TaxID=328813 RepID=UPI00050A19DF|nr:hypothetical protein [Alistipes onderdonkii]